MSGTRGGGTCSGFWWAGASGDFDGFDLLLTAVVSFGFLAGFYTEDSFSWRGFKDEFVGD